MGNAWSINYRVKDVVRVVRTNVTVNVSEPGSGVHEELSHQDVTLYYCGLWTWREEPCDGLIDELWLAIIGGTALVLLILLSVWACQPQVVRVGPTKYSALPPATQPLYLHRPAQQTAYPPPRPHTHHPQPYPAAYPRHPETHTHVHSSQSSLFQPSSTASVQSAQFDGKNVAMAPNACSALGSDGGDCTLRCSFAALVSHA